MGGDGDGSVGIWQTNQGHAGKRKEEHRGICWRECLICGIIVLKRLFLTKLVNGKQMEELSKFSAKSL